MPINAYDFQVNKVNCIGQISESVHEEQKGLLKNGILTLNSRKSFGQILIWVCIIDVDYTYLFENPAVLYQYDNFWYSVIVLVVQIVGYISLPVGFEMIAHIFKCMQNLQVSVNKQTE